MTRKKKLPLVAIVGQPNVGKSSLFNRIIKQRMAIIADIRGTTRDRIYATVDTYAKLFTLIDTGGLAFDDSLFQDHIEQQVQAALDECQAIIFVVDGTTGITTLDERIADIVRRYEKPVFIAVNKCESPKQEAVSADFYSLGFPNIFPVSAQQNLGIHAMLEAVVDTLPTVELTPQENTTAVAVVGRPNVGKSSYINRLLNKEQLIVSDVPGTTRDSVDIHIQRQDQHFVFIDTAGLRYKSKIQDSIEFYSSRRTEESLKRCDVALCLINAEEGLTTQDLKILKMIEEAGKSAVLAINKWDLFPNQHPHHYQADQLDRLNPYAYIPTVFMSAAEGKSISKTLEMIQFVAQERHTRIPTGVLNRFLQKIAQQTPLPHKANRSLKMYYITQAETYPPTFFLSVNDPEILTPAYLKYLEHRFRSEFGFSGSPLRFSCTKHTSTAKSEDKAPRERKPKHAPTPKSTQESSSKKEKPAKATAAPKRLKDSRNFKKSKTAPSRQKSRYSKKTKQ